MEAHGYTTFFQTWDFVPGSNFVLETHRATTLSDRTVAILSPDYLNALFTQPEWAAALVDDPTGVNRKLIPVRVRPCQPQGLLKAIVYVDFVGLNEPDARSKLLNAFGDRPLRPGPGQLPKRHASRFPGQSVPILLYPALSVLCFAAGIALLLLMVSKAEVLAAFDLTGRLFYVTLIPLSLATAGFVFGVLRSIALFRGQEFDGAVVLGAPILVAALVVWGGFKLPLPEPAVFGITVFVHGPGGPQDIVLRGRGNVLMDLGGQRRPESIDNKGAAYFPGIRADFRGREVPITLQCEGFELADSGLRKLTGDSLYLPVRRRDVRFYGMVSDERGEPIVGATMRVGETSQNTDDNGRFDIRLPGNTVSPEMTLDARALGFEPQTLGVTPGANEIRIRLLRSAR